MQILNENESAVPKTIINQDESSGELICACGHQYRYSLRENLNMGNWFDFVVPFCPECKCIASGNRSMDL